MLQAVVLYDFTAEPGNNELSVREGETIAVVDQVNAGVYTAHSTPPACLSPHGCLSFRLWVEVGSRPRTPADKSDSCLRDTYR